jgi:hypothetical protein
VNFYCKSGVFKIGLACVSVGFRHLGLIVNQRKPTSFVNLRFVVFASMHAIEWLKIQLLCVAVLGVF